MGALDQVLVDAEVKTGISEREAHSVLSGLLSLINQQTGGVTGFLSRFNVAGLSAWMSSCLSGEAKPIDAANVTKALGNEAIDKIASSAGVASSSAATAIGLMLPELLQKLAPQKTVSSQLPTELAAYLSTPPAGVRGPMFPPEQIVVKKEKDTTHLLLMTFGILLGVVLLTWLWMRQHSARNAVFDAAAQARLAQDKALAALSSLTPGFTAQELATVLNMNVINFKSGSAEIPSESLDFLNQAAVALKAAPSGTLLEIAGNTDSSGTEESNLELSRQRANAVRDYLTSQGVNPLELEATGYGQSRPLATNDTEEGRFRNRRIEFTVLQ